MTLIATSMKAGNSNTDCLPGKTTGQLALGASSCCPITSLYLLAFEQSSLAVSFSYIFVSFWQGLSDRVCDRCLYFMGAVTLINLFYWCLKVPNHSSLVPSKIHPHEREARSILKGATKTLPKTNGWNVKLPSLSGNSCTKDRNIRALPKINMAS